MTLSDIRLHDFRNYERLRLSLPPGISVLLGDNGQGKTSILEAIYFLSLLRSFRTHKVRHLTRWNAPEFTLHGTLSGEISEQTLAVRHSGESRLLRHNSEPVNRASDFIRQFFCVAFVPDDLALLQGAGSQRRRFLDIQLCQHCPNYLAAAQDYRKALKSRNKILRDEHPNPRALAAFDSVLVPHGEQLIARRAEYAEQLSQVVAELAPQMFAAKCELRIRYRPAAKVGELAQALAQSRERDLQRRQTQAGPHRDDLVITLDGKSLAHYGSEGQCRLAALVLKMAAARLLVSDDSDQPVILLVDDVIGELDSGRREAFFAALRPASQVCFACTSEDVASSLSPASIIDVRDGAATDRES